MTGDDRTVPDDLAAVPVERRPDGGAGGPVATVDDGGGTELTGNDQDPALESPVELTDIEVEVKLGAWPGFDVPDLDDLVSGVRAGAAVERTLEAVYHDTSDLRLVRSGITLRHRTGEGGADGRWTLKRAAGAADAPDDVEGVMARHEHDVDGPTGAVPPELATIVRPYSRAATIGPVAHLQTVRRSIPLVGDADQPVASVDDDEVSVLADARVAARFREVEVEVLAGAPAGLLGALVSRLREAGAGEPDPTPKLVRALGPRALQPPDLRPATPDRTSTAAEVIAAGIADAAVRVVDNDAVIRADVEPEGIHQARVGTRRLRSDLRTFGPLLDRAWVDPIRDELRWFAGLLGEVRDRDVMKARLGRQAGALAEADQEAVLAVLGTLDKERSRAIARAVAALDGRRYVLLLERLVAAAAEPRVLPGADALAVEAVPPLAGHAFRKLRKGVEGLGKRPADEALHEVRILAKKARYAADVAVPVVGDDAKAYTKAVAGLQDILGDHHDCAVAEEWLRARAARASRVQAFALGQLVAHQRHEAARLRGEWRAAWDAVDRKKLLRWMEP
ncbi:MAG: CYTH and CHAD domain-containing protein [Acidimicrobiia bacterium]|nr:CYTH and CHAD domain-containing protein [Acidimicrobiia bacterium]